VQTVGWLASFVRSANPVGAVMIAELDRVVREQGEACGQLPDGVLRYVPRATLTDAAPGIAARVWGTT
jgi:hypothetical protein